MYYRQVHEALEARPADKPHRPRIRGSSASRKPSPM